MKRVIFGTFDFLAPVVFWPIFVDIMDQKMAQSKKVVKIKNQFFHARQPREEIFDIYSHLPVFLQFLAKASNVPQYSNFGNKCPKLGSGTPEDMLFTNLSVAA